LNVVTQFGPILVP